MADAGYSLDSTNNIKTGSTFSQSFGPAGNISFGNVSEVPPSIMSVFAEPQNLIVFGLLAAGLLFFALRK